MGQCDWSRAGSCSQKTLKLYVIIHIFNNWILETVFFQIIFVKLQLFKLNVKFMMQTVTDPTNSYVEIPYCDQIRVID